MASRPIRDLSGEPDHADKRAELMRELATWMMRAQDPLPIPANGYPRKNDPRNYLAPYRP